MRFGVREVTATISVAALIFCCSCDKHHIGEDPEAQREHVDEAKGADENVAEPNKTDVPQSATPNRTPAEFFPKSTPSP